MSTRYPDLFGALAAPFEGNEVKSYSRQGRQLSYVTARTVMNRLDEVLGPENWWDDYVPSENSVLCRLTIRLPDGSTLTKCDAGGYAGMADSGDDDKSGYSDAFKRAAVKFGCARYLYRDGVPVYQPAERSPSPDQDTPHRETPAPPPAAKAPQRRGTRAKEPIDWPKLKHEAPAATATAAAPPTPPISVGSEPTWGKRLWIWINRHEEQKGPGLAKWIGAYGREHGYPGQIDAWSKVMVMQAQSAAKAALAGIYPAK